MCMEEGGELVQAIWSVWLYEIVTYVGSAAIDEERNENVRT